MNLEDIQTEYKLFRFNPLLISQESALDYLHSKKFAFNDSVISTILNYIKIYLPKYISSFLNPLTTISIEQSDALLFFGVDDDGIIHGIPYLGNIDVKKNMKKINLQIDEIFNKYLKFESNEIKQKIKSNLKYEFIKLDIDLNEIECINFTNVDCMYSTYIKQLNTIKHEHKKYTNKKNVWDNLCDNNLLKLNEMINDKTTRKYIWYYIKEKTNYSKKIFRNKYSHLEIYCDVENYWDMIFNINSQRKIKSLETGEIIYVKNDNLNLYRWTTMWKDSKMRMLKQIKPKIPKKTIDENYPLFILSQSNKMVPEWLRVNQNLNLYVLKFTICTKSTQCEIMYKDNENKWKKTFRTIKFDEPITVVL